VMTIENLETSLTKSIVRVLRKYNVPSGNTPSIRLTRMGRKIRRTADASYWCPENCEIEVRFDRKDD
jgi:hypothetical protein